MNSDRAKTVRETWNYHANNTSNIARWDPYRDPPRLRLYIPRLPSAGLYPLKNENVPAVVPNAEIMVEYDLYYNAATGMLHVTAEGIRVADLRLAKRAPHGS